MRVVFDAKAIEDLEGIHDWIAKDNPPVARAGGRRARACER